MMADRKPALQVVRHVLETHPAAKQLVGECQLCMRRSHNWRQFPARSQSAAWASAKSHRTDIENEDVARNLDAKSRQVIE